MSAESRTDSRSQERLETMRALANFGDYLRQEAERLGLEKAAWLATETATEIRIQLAAARSR